MENSLKNLWFRNLIWIAYLIAVLQNGSIIFGTIMLTIVFALLLAYACIYMSLNMKMLYKKKNELLPGFLSAYRAQNMIFACYVLVYAFVGIKDFVSMQYQ